MEGGYCYFPLLGEAVADWAFGVEWGTIPVEQNSDVPVISSHAPKEIRSIHDVKTLKDCLIFFSLSEVLSELDGSLDRVRKRQESKEDHEAFSKKIDKTLQRKSFEYHPDRVSNRGGTPDELLEAQRAQTAINATRTVLNILSQDFLDDLDIDHKYKFYAKLELNSLGNEEEIKKHIKHVLHKTVWLSEIKQLHIIAQIRMFLSESRSSLQSYFEENLTQFKMHRDYALYHLNKCIDGYDKLHTEFKIISEECRKERLGHILSVIKEMENKSVIESQTLKSLMDVAKLSLSGQFQVFSQWKNVDDYLVLPFVYYVNAMLMCSLMQSKKHKNPLNILSYKSTHNGYIYLKETNDLETMLNSSINLAYELYNEYHSKTSNIYEEKKTTEKDIKVVFDKFMKDIKDELENRFKIEAYVEGGNRNFISRQYSNCMNVAKDIDDKVLNLFQDMENCKTINKEVQEKYDKVMKQSCGFETDIEECLEQSKVLHEEVSRAFTKSHATAATEEVNFAKGSDDMERLIAESLLQSRLLHEKVSKILNRKSQETDETTSKLNSNITESIVENVLLHEQVLSVIQQGKNETEKSEKEFENKFNVDDPDDLERHVDNIFVSLNVSKNSQTSDKSFIHGKTNPIEVRYGSMAVVEENPLPDQVLQQNENFVGVSMEVDSKADECSDGNNSFLGEFHPACLITEKPNGASFCSSEVVEKHDNEGQNPIEVDDQFEKELFTGGGTVMNHAIKDGISSFTEMSLKRDKREEKLLEGNEQNPVFAGHCYSHQKLDENGSNFVKDATEVTKKSEWYSEKSQTTDKNFVDGNTNSVDVGCRMAVTDEKHFPDPV